MVTVNYLVAAGVLAAYLQWRGGIELGPSVALVGGVTGFSFMVSMFLMTRALEVSDAAVVLTAFRLSIVVPIAVSVLLWNEEISARQLAGVSMAMLSLVLMSAGTKGLGMRGLVPQAALAVSVCLLQGVSHTCARWVHHAGLDGHELEVLLVTTGSAGLLGAAALGFAGRSPTWDGVRMGAGIGVFNALALAIFLITLARLSSAQFFPVTGCAVVIMDVLFARAVWRERVSLLTAAGAAAGAGSMLLVF